MRFLPQMPPRADSSPSTPHCAQRLAGLPALLAATVALATGAAAQTVTVGPPGSGAMFARIQDGINAVAAGGTVLVAPGDFVTTNPLVIDKPLTLLGAGRGQTRHTLDATLTRGAVSGIEISRLGLGEQVVVGGMTVLVLPPTGSATGITVSNCADVVQLVDLGCALTSTSTSSSQGVVQVRDAAAVSIDGCAFVSVSSSVAPAPALLVERSFVLVNDCFLGGGSQMRPFGPVPVFDGEPGLAAIDSVVRLARSSVRGGPGSTNSNASAPPFASNGGPGVLALGSEVSLRAGPGNEMIGGRGASAPLGMQFGLGAPALSLDAASFLTHTSDARMIPGADGNNQVTAPTIGGQGVISVVPNPLATAGADPDIVAPGASVTISTNGEASAIALPLLALAATLPTTLPGVLGVLTLDVASLLPLTASTLDANGAATAVLTLPPDPTLAGATAWVQALTFAPSGLLSLSDPCVIAVR